MFYFQLTINVYPPPAATSNSDGVYENATFLPDGGFLIFAHSPDGDVQHIDLGLDAEGLLSFVTCL